MAPQHRARPTVLVGVGERALAAAQEVIGARNGYWVVGMVAEAGERPDPRLAGLPVLGTPGDLPRVTRETGARAVVVALDRPLERGLTPALLSCGLAGIDVLDMPRLCEILSGRVPLDQVAEDWLLTEVFSSTRSAGYHWVKRALDIVVSVAALGLFSLIFPALALVIRLSSSGGIMFRQERLGFRGKRFEIHKLRTMVREAESGGTPLWASANDRRVTGVGRFLRRTRLDEVPQFWNVLWGDMTVVGPRPERPFFVEKLRRKIPHYDWRHLVRPGITGWAQVNQGYAASAAESFRKLELDFYYIKNRSLSLDLKILWRTAWVVLGCKGAR